MNISLNSSYSVGKEIYEFSNLIFPLHRSITGEGVRKTLNFIKQEIPSLILHELPTGSVCYDWDIPKEWSITCGYISTMNGNKIVDIKKNNLHVVSYSTPIDCVISLEDLKSHLHTRPDLPNAIPYITSYFRENWGFCISHDQFNQLKDPFYKVKIDSSLYDGSLTYADLLIRGRSEKEVIISTYICHPSMGNNETSGMAVATYLAKYISQIRNPTYSYRFVFVPETIGAIAYIHQNYELLRKNTIAGFIITCVGDDRAFSFMPSRYGNTLADKVAVHVLEKCLGCNYTKYSFLDRGSDERQYCAPNVNLPFVSLMRSKYGTYPEYHTSLDDLNLISPDGLEGGYQINKLAIDALELNKIYKSNSICEPFLSKRGLRPPLVNGVTLTESSKLISNILAYSDGNLDLIDIANELNCSIFTLAPIIEILKENGLLIEA